MTHYMPLLDETVRENRLISWGNYTLLATHFSKFSGHHESHVKLFSSACSIFRFLRATLIDNRYCSPVNGVVRTSQISGRRRYQEMN
jgi:hypothetical protein